MLLGMERVNRIAYVDGLRAVAVLLVVVHHAVKYAPVRVPLLQRVLFQGHHGVEVFFVLSGFCLSYPTLAKIHETGSASFDIARYAAARIVRIVPPYYAAIIFFAFAGPYRVSATDIARQAGFLDAGTQWLNGSFWSLATEFRWYFLFPVALLLWLRAPRVFMATIVGLYLLWNTKAGSLDVASLPLFMSGIIAAHLAITRPSFARYAVIALPVLLVVAFVETPANDIGGVLDIKWQVTAFTFVVACGSIAWLRKLASHPALTVIGTASYAIYLIHEPLVMMLERASLPPFGAVVCSLAAGLLFWLIAERPFVETRLRDRLRQEFNSVAMRFLRWLRITPFITLRASAPSVPDDLTGFPELQATTSR
jgi:peptidoglycan/LPS O-acetylase OafA/YrhL